MLADRRRRFRRTRRSQRPAGGQAAAGQRLQLLEARPVVLQAGGQRGAPRGVQRQHRLEAPRRVAGKDDDAVAVADVGFQACALPALFQRFEADLHHRHADDPLALAQAVGQVVAGFAGGAADAVEAPGLALQGVLEVGAERQVLALEAVGVAPVAGRHHPAAAVEQVDGAAAAALVETFEVGVDRGAARLVGGEQQGTDGVLQLQHAGQVAVAADRAFQGAGVQFQLALGVALQLAQAGLQAEVVGDEAAAEHQQHDHQRHMQGERARFHGQRGRQGAAVVIGELHHKALRAASAVPRRPARGAPAALRLSAGGSWRGTAGRVRSGHGCRRRTRPWRSPRRCARGP